MNANPCTCGGRGICLACVTPATPSNAAIECNLSPEQREALRRIVGDWISEGFTRPPYGDAYYDIFEWLGLADNDPYGYDARRPE